MACNDSSVWLSRNEDRSEWTGGQCPTRSPRAGYWSTPRSPPDRPPPPLEPDFLGRHPMHEQPVDRPVRKPRGRWILMGPARMLEAANIASSAHCI